MNRIAHSGRLGGGAVPVAFAALLRVGCGSVPRTVPGSTTAGTTAGTTPPATAAPTAEHVQRAIEGLAALGIETRVRPTDNAPVAPVPGDRSLVRLLRFQIGDLAMEQAAGGGISGADLDALTAAAGGESVSALLTAWAASGPTPAAEFASSLLPQRPAAGDPSSATFPAIALLTFVADATAGARTAGVHHTVRAVAHGPAGPAVNTSAGLVGAQDAAGCAEISAYLSAALGDVVDTDADPPAWLKQLIDLYAPQYASDPDLLRRTIGALALVAYASSLARPWTVSLRPDPLAVAYGIDGQDPVEGEVVLTVAAEELFGEDVAQCAQLVDARLASVPIPGSSVVWDPSGFGVHAKEVSSFTTLDEIDSASLTYQTTTETQDAVDRGDPVTTQMRVSAWVDRAEMATLAGVVKSILLGDAAGSPAGPTARALYDAMEPKLTAVMRPSGSAVIDVTYHALKASPRPSATQPPTSAVTGTWDGTWQNDLGYGDLPPATGGVVLLLEQTGAKVTGTARFSGMTCVTEVPIEGTVQGFTLDLPMPSQWDIRFVGTLEGDSMSGTYSALACWPKGFVVTGTWHATRE